MVDVPRTSQRCRVKEIHLRMADARMKPMAGPWQATMRAIVGSPPPADPPLIPPEGLLRFAPECRRRAWNCAERWFASMAPLAPLGTGNPDWWKRPVVPEACLPSILGLD